MAKVTIEYDAVEEAYELELALNAWKWKAALRDLDQKLRSTVKYGSGLKPSTSDASQGEQEFAEQCRELIREILADYDLFLD